MALFGRQCLRWIFLKRVLGGDDWSGAVVVVDVAVGGLESGFPVRILAFDMRMFCVAGWCSRVVVLSHFCAHYFFRSCMRSAFVACAGFAESFGEMRKLFLHLKVVVYDGVKFHGRFSGTKVGCFGRWSCCCRLSLAENEHLSLSTSWLVLQLAGCCVVECAEIARTTEYGGVDVKSSAREEGHQQVYSCCVV